MLLNIIIDLASAGAHIHFVILCSKLHAHLQTDGNFSSHQKQLLTRESLKMLSVTEQRYLAQILFFFVAVHSCYLIFFIIKFYF